MRDVFCRIERLEARVVASTRETMDIRVLLVHPEKGLTGDQDESHRQTFTPA